MRIQIQSIEKMIIIVLRLFNYVPNAEMFRILEQNVSLRLTFLMDKDFARDKKLLEMRRKTKWQQHSMFPAIGRGHPTLLTDYKALQQRTPSTWI